MRDSSAAWLPSEARDTARRLAALSPPSMGAASPAAISIHGGVGAYVPLAQRRGDTVELQIKEVRRACGACGALTTKRCQCCAASFCGAACFQPHREACRKKT